MSELSGTLGDIFWDLAPAIVYTSGVELGATIYVANPTVETKEYALLAQLYTEDTFVSEEAVKVFGAAWFTVEPGDFVRLRGAFIFEETDVALTLLLIERETGEVTDAVTTYLVSPEAAASGWPIGWPGGTSAISSDYSWLMPLMMLGIGMVGIAAVTSGRQDKEKPKETKALATTTTKEQKLLPPGRSA